MGNVFEESAKRREERAASASVEVSQRNRPELLSAGTVTLEQRSEEEGRSVQVNLALDMEVQAISRGMGRLYA